ncbi:helix-turn-helix domain-containing protein [Dapis sp. BLCC M229]
MKARFKYRIYPTPGQKYRLSKLFGCVCWRNASRTCGLER